MTARVILTAALAVLVAGCGHSAQNTTTTTPPAPSPAGQCRYASGSGLFVTPDQACTPGQWIDTTGTGVCHRGYNPRPALSVTRRLKTQALHLYGLPTRQAAKYELDHRFPVWLGGATVIQNLWPEPNYPRPLSTYVRNPKDNLEVGVKGLYDRVCRTHSLTVAQARAVFEGDWTVAYRQYIGPT